MFRTMNAVQQMARRSICSSARRQFLENKVPQMQKKFQEDNGLPIHLKGGTSDVLLYRTTMVLSILGVGLTLYELVKASFPQKKKN